jgi:hypothetical protein
MLAITTDPFEFLTALAKIGGYICLCLAHGCTINHNADNILPHKIAKYT